MTKRIIFICLLFAYFNLKAQVKFEKGNFIDNDGQKTECLIKNVEWLYNPKKIDFKLNESAAEKTLTIQSIKEFVIYESSKYVRFPVKIDTSDVVISNLSKTRKPEFKEDTIFLRVLIEGKATLYDCQYYGSILRYFYKLEDANNAEQLVFKKYFYDGTLTIKSNEDYKNQLRNNLQCDKISLGDIERLEYIKNDLVKFFSKYNTCANSTITTYEKPKERKNFFNLKGKFGLNYAGYQLKYLPSSSRDIDFSNKVSFKLGVETEFILPFNKNKWSIIFEPTFQFYDNNNSSKNASISYNSIELPLGFRHYLYLNEKSKFFLNAFWVYDFILNSKLAVNTLPEFSTKSNFSFMIGGGFSHKKKYLEVRYTSREILGNYYQWASNFEAISLIFGLRIL